MDKKAPNFALLIGKPNGSKDEPVDHEADLEKDSDGMDKGGAEDSAVKDLISAVHDRDVDATKAALKDFVEICYPDLAGPGDAEEEPEEEGPEESADAGY